MIPSAGPCTIPVELPWPHILGLQVLRAVDHPMPPTPLGSRGMAKDLCLCRLRTWLGVKLLRLAIRVDPLMFKREEG